MGGDLDCDIEYWRSERQRAATGGTVARFYEANCAILELFDKGCVKQKERSDADVQSRQAGE